jgi:hypothetical protein
VEATIAAVVTVGWKWAAILIGLGVLVLLEFAVFLGSGSWNPWKIVVGEDGRVSTSKFQWFLWLMVVLFAYVTLWVIRARGGDYSALPDIPVNVMTVLGFSTGTAAIAKGIAVANAPRRAAAAAAKAVAPGSTPAGPPPPLAPPAGKPAQGLLVDDSTNLPDIAKVQMVGFTFVALGIFLATLFHQIASNPVATALPDIDSSLLVLMGISQGGYLAKKITSGTG